MMSGDSKYLSNNFFQTVRVLKLMAKPRGTTVEELCRELRLNRRSIFRLLKTIEHDLKIPVVIHRELFGGIATYRLDSGFIEKMSHASLPALPLSFEQSLVIYLLLAERPFTQPGKTTDDSEGLWERLNLIFSDTPPRIRS
jgi:hypothetical protein